MFVDVVEFIDVVDILCGEGRCMETCDLNVKPIELKSYFINIKLRSNPKINSPTMNNTFIVVLKNSNFN